MAQLAAPLIINAASLKASEENGSIELWPGSHHEMVITKNLNDGIRKELNSVSETFVQCLKGSVNFHPWNKKGKINATKQ